MNIKHPYLSIMAGALLITTACTKTEPPGPTPKQNGKLEITLTHQCNGSKLLFDTINYQNLAGNKYSVTNLVYYLSLVTLIDENEVSVSSNAVLFIDGNKSPVVHLLNDIPVGTYKRLRFNIGIDAAHNVTGKLENTPENVNMQWPEAIGGGYHFLKFEGNFLDSLNKPMGFAVHLGTQPTLVTHDEIPVNLIISETDITKIHLVMNVNEWFQNPYAYDLQKDGNYTMAVEPLMNLIKNNGHDVFHLQP